jgi:hypothetical protein
MKMKYPVSFFNSCVLFVLFSFCFVEVAVAAGRRPDNLYYYRQNFHELGFSFSGGISGVFFNSSQSQMGMKPNDGWSFSVMYFYNIRPNLSLVVDVSASYHTLEFNSGAIDQTKWEAFMFDTVAVIGLNSRLEQLTERLRVVNSSLALKLRYNVPSGGAQYYLELGGKLGSTVWNSYVASAARQVTMGDFPEFLQRLQNIPGHSFGVVNDVSYRGKSVFSRLNFFVTFETGFKYSIGENVFVHTGLFVECGFLKSAANGENFLVSYNPDDLRSYRYAGLLQTDIIKNGRMLMIFGGVKFSFTFDLFKY